MTPLSGYFPKDQGIFPDGPEISQVPCWSMVKTAIEFLKERLEARMAGKKPAPFAGELGLKPDVIRDIFRKDAMPSAERLAVIADGLDVSIDYLLGRTDNPTSTAPRTLRSEEDVKAALEQIYGLNDEDVRFLMKNIKSAWNANGVEPLQSRPRDQSESSSLPHAKVPFG